MSVECSICNKSFTNKNSLYQHRNKYHRKMDKTSNGEKKYSLPHPAFGNNIPQFEEDSSKKGKYLTVLKIILTNLRVTVMLKLKEQKLKNTMMKQFQN